MIFLKVSEGLNGLEEAKYVRTKVFVEEQGISIEEEMDRYDENAVFALVLSEKEPIATGRIIVRDEEFLIGRVAVLREYRKKGYGEKIIKMLIYEGFRKGAKEICVHSQIQAKGFYEKMGFVSFGGVFEEVGIEHIKMKIIKN